MNCKPGDLAVVLRGGCGLAAANKDRIVEVLRPYPFIIDGEHSWIVSGGGLVDPEGLPCRLLGIKDSDLRPIRDPGEDAQDESLSWLPVPSREEVTQ